MKFRKSLFRSALLLLLCMMLLLSASALELHPKEHKTRYIEPLDSPAPPEAAPYNEQLPDSDDKIHFLNLGATYTSDCFLIESNGCYMLVDTSNPDEAVGGQQWVPDNTANIDAVMDYLRNLGVEVLDYVVLTHNHSDHIGGVARLCEEGFITDVTTVYYRTDRTSGEDRIFPDWDSPLYIRRAIEALNASKAYTCNLLDEGITKLSLEVGDFTIDFLNLDNNADGVVDFDPNNENNNSILLKVTKGEIDTLLTGDIEYGAEYALAPMLSQVEILKIPHHGHTTSSSFAFLSATKPETAIVTSDIYWHEAAYGYLQRMGGTLYMTANSPGSALVAAIGEDDYTLLDAVPYRIAPDDGWYSWEDQYCYIQDGTALKSRWLDLPEGRYCLDENGFMLTGTWEVNGVICTFGEDGLLEESS